MHDICHSFSFLPLFYFADFHSSECSINFAPFPQIVFFAKTKHVLKLPPQPNRQSFLPPSMVWCGGLFGVNPAWWTRMRTDHQGNRRSSILRAKKGELLWKVGPAREDPSRWCQSQPAEEGQADFG